MHININILTSIAIACRNKIPEIDIQQNVTRELNNIFKEIEIKRVYSARIARVCLGNNL